MNISDVIIRKTFNEGYVRAVVSIILNNSLAIHNIRIIQGANRLFIAMPSRKGDNEIFRDIIHPINAFTRADFEDSILNAYEQYIALEAVMDANNHLK